ncbi:MAG: hypothetical protein LC804_04330 [Acidobacteria bacterium]|nr:hypothetical protein [Acidobacteriota bacterium]
MSRRFTALTVVLTAVVAFLVGLIIAGEFTPAPVVSSAPRVASSGVARSARVTGGPSVVNFADVAERINAAVVNIDATSKTPRELSRRSATRSGTCTP